MQRIALLGSLALSLNLLACAGQGSDSGPPNATETNASDSGSTSNAWDAGQSPSTSDSGETLEGDGGAAANGGDASNLGATDAETDAPQNPLQGLGSGGPAIDCTGPADGAMINAAPGSSVAFAGSTTGPNGLSSVTVNGAPAILWGSTFSANVPTRFGINFVDIVATDTKGASSTRACSFLVADQWAAENTLYADTIDVKLTQNAIDEGTRANGIQSFADIVSVIANSPGLVSTLNGALTGMNPVMPQSCQENLCVPGVCIPPTPITPGYCITPPYCYCALSFGVDITDVSLPGPQSVSLTLVDGGLQVTVHAPTVGVDLGIFGDVGPLPIGVGGPVSLSDVTITMTFGISVSGGQLHASLQSSSTTVGNVTTDFQGWAGDIINVVVPWVQGGLVPLVENELGGNLSGQIGPMLDGVLSGLNLAGFGTTINVPSLAGSPIPLTLGVGLTSLSATSSRLLIGLGSEFSAPTGQPLPSLGIAIPDGTVLDDTAVNAPADMGFALHVGVLNQAFHALWRGGMFNGTVTGAALGGGLLPADVIVQLETKLPPVADLLGSSVELSLGGLEAQVTYPGMFGGAAGAPLEVEVGGRITATPALTGGSLQIGNLALTEIHFSTGSIELSSATNQAITLLLQNMLQQMVIQSLNSALPAVPIPSFAFPAELQAFGLSGQLGLTNPALGNDPNDLVLLGSLGQ